MENLNTITFPEIPKPARKKPAWVRVLGVFGVIALAISILAFANDLAIKNQLAPLNAAGDQLGDYFKAAGGVEIKREASQASYGLDIFLRCGDVRCPAAERHWHVPVAPGNNKQFIVDALKKEGWTVEQDVCDYWEALDTGRSCYVKATKGRLEILVDMGITGIRPPSHDVSPRVWRAVGIGITVLPEGH